MVGRLTSALVHAEPDAAEAPMRRTSVGWIAGLVIGALIFGGFAVFGLILPSGKTNLAQPGTLFVQKETGTRYVFAGGSLHPVTNYASALLLLKSAKPTLQSVSTSSLDGVPHGQPLGIEGAPDALPDPTKLRRGRWLVCAASGADTADTPQSQVTLQISGDPLPPVPDDEALVVRTPDGTNYLAWRDRRLKLNAPWIAVALGFGSATPITVDPAWINALPAGPDLGSIPVEAIGKPGPTIGKTSLTAGQIAVMSNVGTQDTYYLVRTTGLVPLTRFAAAMALADPATAQAYPNGSVQPIQLDPSALAAAGVATSPPNGTPDLPTSTPHPATLAAGQVPCAQYDGNPAHQDARLVAAAPPPASALPVTGRHGVTGDSRVASRIAVAPGSGALVRPLLASGAAGVAYYLVTDIGVKFPLASTTVAETLGYNTSVASLVPSSMLALLPTGPALDPTALGG